MISATPALIETYSVLTRLPSPYRVPAAFCLAVLERNFIRDATVVALAGDAYLDLLRRAAEGGIAGGRIYDAVIAACGLAAGADALLTFNDRHFLPFAGQGMAIVVPSVAAPPSDQS